MADDRASFRLIIYLSNTFSTLSSVILRRPLDDCAPAELINFNFSLITWQFAPLCTLSSRRRCAIGFFRISRHSTMFFHVPAEEKNASAREKIDRHVQSSVEGDYEPHNSMLHWRGFVDRGYVLLKNVIFILFHAVYDAVWYAVVHFSRMFFKQPRIIHDMATRFAHIRAGQPDMICSAASRDDVVCTH